MPHGHSAGIASMSSNDATTNITVKDVGSGRTVEVMNSTSGAVVGSQFLDGIDDASISVSSQSNPFRGQITVTSRNSPYTSWTSKIFDKIYHGDTFVLIVTPTYNPPIARGYTMGTQDGIPKMLKYSQFNSDIIKGHDNEYFSDNG